MAAGPVPAPAPLEPFELLEPPQLAAKSTAKKIVLPIVFAFHLAPDTLICTF
jgi:hypothetical protein